MKRYKAHSKEITALLKHDSILLSGSADRTIRLWKDSKTVGVFSDPEI